MKVKPNRIMLMTHLLLVKTTRHLMHSYPKLNSIIQISSQNRSLTFANNNNNNNNNNYKITITIKKIYYR